MASEAPSSRRWTARLLQLLPRRRRRAPDVQPAVVQASADTRLIRRSRRTHRRRPSVSRPAISSVPYSQSNSAPILPSQAAVRIRRVDDTRELLDTNHSATLMYSVLADGDMIEGRDMLAIVDRLSDEDEYQMSIPEYQYFHERLRSANMRARAGRQVVNGYYIPSRRQARAHALADNLALEFHRNMRLLNSNRIGSNTNAYECAASEEQIEALPTIVMEKGETRSIKEIFDSIREDGASSEQNYEDFDGVTRSYSECAICLSDFEAGDKITSLPCGHFFHLTGCVKEWLKNHARTCPTCRADICAGSCGSDDVNSHSATMATSEDLT